MEVVGVEQLHQVHTRSSPRSVRQLAREQIRRRAVVIPHTPLLNPTRHVHPLGIRVHTSCDSPYIAGNLHIKTCRIA